MGYRFDQPIDGAAWPAFVQRLTFRSYFNRRFAGGLWLAPLKRPYQYMWELRSALVQSRVAGLPATADLRGPFHSAALARPVTRIPGKSNFGQHQPPSD